MDRRHAGRCSLLVTRRGDAIEVRYRLDGGGSELAALAYLPPGEPVVAGAMCAAPEGRGFQVAFHDLTITRPAKSPRPDVRGGSQRGR